ncbi:Sucrase/ferredoxin-like-domain-containing protein [Linnemannia elongata]|nr:Sucrase/ferredoxin-like-domain-containing protein [Linnemannia elongata]
MNYMQKLFLTAKRVAIGGAEVDVDAPPFVGLSDCSACPNPCDDDDHPHYPSYLKINQTMPLLHSVKPYERHVLISTGKEDWEGHIDSDKSSLAFYLQNAIDKGQQRLRDSDNGQSVYRIVLTNSSRMADTWDGPGWQVIVLPDQIVVNNVTPEQCDDFFEAFLEPPFEGTWGQSAAAGTVTQGQETTTASQDDTGSNTNTGSSASTGVERGHLPLSREVKAGKMTFTAHRWQAKAAIMICSHKKRDKRCGITAAILKKEFTRILRSKDLLGDAEGDVEIWLVSHIGGHKFAGNVIVHRGGVSVWYGRVEPCHSQAIVDTTVERGEIIRELYRGGANGHLDAYKEVSW